MDKEIKGSLRVALEEGFPAALVTVTKVIGSAPRKPGAQMLVYPDGTTIGTVGGGCGEAEAKREALQVMTTAGAKKHRLIMTADIAEDEGMVCGGVMELFIDYIGPSLAQEEMTLLENYLLAFDQGESPVLVTLTESPMGNSGRKMVIYKDGRLSGDLGSPELNRLGREHARAEDGRGHFSVINLDEGFLPCLNPATKMTYQLLIEPPVSEIQMVVLGAGHIGLPLANIAKILGYEVTVIDDRPSFANTVRFKTADKVICNDFEKALDDLEIGPQTYVVIVTRGHRHDKLCLRKLIPRPAGYIGMIGSRRRVKALLADLQEEGIPAEQLAKLYSPIGLKIGAETPEEIAICILAEIIKVQKEQAI